MTTDAWITTAVLVITLGALFGRRVGPASAMLAATASLFVLGVTDSAQAFGGFSSEAPWVIAGLYVIAGVVQQTGALTGLLSTLMDSGPSLRRTLTRLTVPAALSSAIVANTPVVATLAPAITRWTGSRGKGSGALLMPLSFATILGGTLTVIGSSTNVAASGLLDSAGEDSITMFDLVPVSAPVVIIGLVYLIVFAPLLLDSDRDGTNTEPEARFVARFVAQADRAPIGSTIQNLRSSLAGIEAVRRHDKLLTDEDILQDGDVMVVIGPSTAVIEARETFASSPAEEMGRRYFEAVVAPGSPWTAAVLGDSASPPGVFARRLERGTVPLAPLRRGDTVLVCANPQLMRSTSSNAEFSLAARIDTPPSRSHLARRAVPIALATVIAASIGQIGVLRAVVCGVGTLVVAGTVRPREALRLVNIEVVVLIGAALGVGAAVERSGLASAIVEQIESVAASTHPTAGVVVLLVATVLMTELLTNVAAVAILLPVAIALGPHLAVDERQLALSVVVAASASFLTPFGYQTNTMIWRPGGYEITDFTRLGAPLTLLVVATLTIGVIV
ncbi:MAG: hypothetical protein GY925_18550 [Actinomycetia bacterium]|nr:hypothetical protein [Actinomycetes bacterium]